MPSSPCLYRRPSGVYAVRIVVPKRLRDLVGRGEIHASTGLRDWNAAKIAALKIQLHWRERLMSLDVDKLTAGSPLLLGDGVIPIQEAARATGLPIASLLGEMLNARAPLFVQAQGWKGWQVDDLDAIEVDYDGSFILNDVKAQGHRHALSGVVQIHDSAAAVGALIADGKATSSLLLLSGRAAFFTDGDQQLSIAACLAPKSVIEGIRARLAGSIPTATSSTPTPAVAPAIASGTPAIEAPVIVLDPITARHGKKRFSELFETYKADRDWRVDNARRMTTEARLFIDLMGDPALGEIEKETILEYGSRLGQLPNDIYQSKRKFKTDSLHDLIEIAERENLPCKTEQTVKGHIGRLSEILKYGADSHMLRFNPAADYRRGRGKAAMQRAQDERQVFSPAELNLIFSQEWFRKGTGEFHKSGWTTWRPHYYWLPLLGLLTGARLNELSQLYLDDITQSDEDPAVWYIDFNLNQPDKQELDEADPATDKTFKTVNAIRVVPLHDKLVELGLPEYVAALRREGITRLFPERTRDSVKGYGKPAGSWFNERFLGHKLGIERNGKKTFHSLRHCFLTATERLDLTERVMAQLAGHQRGDTQSGTRYAKDRSAEELKPIMDRLNYPCLSDVARFQIKPALKALGCSKKHKRAVARSKSLR